MNLKKVLFASIMSGVLLLGGCGIKKNDTSSTSSKEVTVKIMASATPHTEILEHIKPVLKKEGVNLEIISSDEQANESVRDKIVDANYNQHLPYLKSVAKEINFDYSVLAAVHVEPIGFYSNKIKSIDQLKNGAKILITNDPSNEYRMLVLLQSKGLIKLKDGIDNFKATPKDIVENPKNLKFIEVDSGLLTRNLPEVDGAIINTNRILEAGIDPKTALFREDAKSPYANLVVVRKGDEKRPELQKLKKALLTDNVRNFINKKYGVAVVPVF